MFAIRQKRTDIWAGAKNITYFVTSDSVIDSYGSRRTREESLSNSAYFGVPVHRRRLFETTDQIRRALATIAWGNSVLRAIEIDPVLGNEISVPQNIRSRETFSAYEVVNLFTSQVHTLDAVLAKEI